MTLADYDVGSAETFWSNYAHTPYIGLNEFVQDVDGGPVLAPTETSYQAGLSESDLDVQQSGAISPGDNIIVYQAPNTDAGSVDALARATSQNQPVSVSARWDESETYFQCGIANGEETTACQQAFDEVFEEMAARGRSGFVSVGDDGAYDAQPDQGSTNLSVDAPGDSPYCTTAGGTTLPWSGTLTGPVASATVTVSQQRA